MTPLKRIRIMVVAGGSGGHIFPAVGFCQDLKESREDSVEIFLVTTASSDISGWVPDEFRPIFLNTNKSFFGLVKLVFNAVFIFLRLRPHIVFGFGGYSTVPFVMLAKIFGKKTIIHEQNVVPGKANQFLSSFCDRIAISFPDTKRYLKEPKKALLTHFPYRASLEQVVKSDALKFFGFDANLFTVLVAGGSQGATSINKHFIEALKGNPNLSQMQIIHIAGKKDFDFVSKEYSAIPVKSKVFAFLNEMNFAYCASDFIISRAGASAVMEIMRFELPSILIPYPFAQAHQLENARFLAKNGAAILLEEKSLRADMLNGLLNIFIYDKIRKATMSSLARSLYENADKLRLSDLVQL